MKLLEYSVAWIDDQPQDVRGHADVLRTKLAKQGLHLQVHEVAEKASLQAFLQALNEDSDYDLILVDWKLGQMAGGGTGATLAKAIRDQHSHATIIFYSAESPQTLRKAIADQLIDGVWCVNRNWFGQEAWHIVQAGLRRLDLNAMRGLFLSAVAEFDHKMKSALVRALDQTHGDVKVRLATSMLERKLKYLHEQIETLEQHLGALSPATSSGAFLGATKPGTSDLHALLQEVNAMAGLIDAPHKAVTNLLNEFDSAIVTPRNDLAHARSSFNEGKETLTRNGRSYDGNRFSELRTLLMQHHENLTIISEKYVAEITDRINRA